MEGGQPTRANGQVARPQNQPGAIPPAPNGEPGQGLQWQPDPQGNRGGFFGRFMGVGGMPPVGHGQFPVVPQPRQAPQANGDAAPNQQVPPPPPLHPLPYPRPNVGQGERFPGFFTPDGIWHAWPQPDINVNNRAQDTPDRGVTAATRTTAPSPGAEGTNQQSSGANGESSSAADRTPSASTSLSSSAREAAVAAALRRSSPSSSSVTTVQNPAVSEAHATPQPDSQTSGQNNGNQRNNGPTGSSDPSTSPRESNVSHQTPAPTFIPLFDPHISSPPRSRMQSRVTLRGVINARPDSSWSEQVRNPMSGRQQDTGSLPPIVTEQQLQVLDRLTREAIDERLRILENVQLTTARCAIDLLRCRSMLPRSNNVTQPTPDAPNEDSQNPREGSSSVLDREPRVEGPIDDGSQPPQPIDTGA